MLSTATMAPAFAHDRFHARRKFFTLVSPQFYLYDLDDNIIAYVKQKAFKLREDIRVYADESMTYELLRIKARSILDFSVAYDVEDAATGQKLGALKRRGWKSLLRDEWILMDANDRDLVRIREESTLLATLRRFLTNLIPQSYIFEMNGQPLGTAAQRFNPFVFKMDVDLTDDVGRRLDRRLAAAAVVLLMAVEGRQD
jgi:hypothetical protein